MELLLTISIAFLTLALGFFVARMFTHLREKTLIIFAEDDAEKLISDAKALAAEQMDLAQERAQDVEEQIRNQNKKEIEKLEARVEELEMKYRAKRSESDREFSLEQKELQKQIVLIQEHSKKLEQRQKQYDTKKQEIKNLNIQYIQKLAQKTEQSENQVRADILSELENNFHIEAKKKASLYEEMVKLQSEPIAKHLLANALNRYPREASTERGIGVVDAADPQVKQKLFGTDNTCIQKLSELCGVDIELNQQDMVQVSGFDPVRRELATRCLERLVNEKNINLKVVEKIYETSKKEVLKKIENDGRRIAQELGQNDLHSEIKNMLGCLRYRYSFSQNQLFHVGEVGRLCGLLASELGGVSITDAKRSGLLHDIGKAMDHSIEGGHAVIGADFIKKWGEKEQIVHAVRSHHYEEQPNSDLAFLVIAADAISGARPGARRSTVTSYNQKIEALSSIADDFPGVLRTLVFNAGREVRIIVDSHKINDQAALKLCREIALKIEDECSYPGQIKVVVVRETHAEAVAK